MRKKYKDAEYPVFEIVCDDSNGTGIKLLSIVADPAIEMMGMCFNKNGALKNYEFKAQQDKQIIIGPALIPNKKILRKDADGNPYFNVFKAETIVKLVEKYNSQGNNRRINVDHSKTMVEAYIMENWIVEDTTYDKSTMYGFEVPIGTWMVMVKIEDPKFWKNEVKDLSKFGFSIEGILGEKPMEYYSTIEEAIDDLTPEETTKLFNEVKYDYKTMMFKGAGYDTPPVHPNCKCNLFMGEWILGDSKTGECDQCVELASMYNSYNAVAFGTAVTSPTSTSTSTEATTKK